jgi:hypothetical protein
MTIEINSLLQILGLRESEQELFARCLNRLFGETFILREYDREDYYFIQRHQEAIAGYLSLAQWDLVQDPLGQVFQAINRQESNRRNLKRLETELLLMFCICYLRYQSPEPDPPQGGAQYAAPLPAHLRARRPAAHPPES